MLDAWRRDGVEMMRDVPRWSKGETGALPPTTRDVPTKSKREEFVGRFANVG